jgi:hypothetical protein
LYCLEHGIQPECVEREATRRDAMDAMDVGIRGRDARGFGRVVQG